MNGDSYRVTGVLDAWTPTPKFYDVNNQTFGKSEGASIFHFSLSIEKEVGSNGNTNCWKPVDGNGYDAFKNSECVWMQFWVELHGSGGKGKLSVVSERLR